MQHSEKIFLLSDTEQKILSESITAFCSVQNRVEQQKFLQDIKDQLSTFYAQKDNNKHAIGAWVFDCLQLLIPNIHELRQSSQQSNVDFVVYLKNLPFAADSADYISLLGSVNQEDVIPLGREDYVELLQISVLLMYLGSEKALSYIEELKPIAIQDNNPSGHSVYIKMLIAKSLQLTKNYLDEQMLWLDLVADAWLNLDSNSIVYCLVQWVVSLHWVRPNTLRKELIILLYETERHTNSFNQAILQYELFNLPEKIITTGEKLLYLGKLRNMPVKYFTDDQLQNMYYFSGSIKSSIESSFMESVSDFQYSNYYIYKRWNWIRNVNHFFMKLFNPTDYMIIQNNIELKIIDLINMINIQSNAFVEALQSNFCKIEELYHQVEDLSLRDTLTGLYNRRYLYNNINELLLLAARHQSSLSFVMVDIDDFKPINDTYGHLAGDYILSELATIFKNSFRKSDFIVRYGGEEFLIVLFESDNIQTAQTMDVVRQELAEREFRYQNFNLHVTISIGIASCIFENPMVAINLEKLISEADDALYESKHNGKNRITTRVLTLN